MIFLGGVATIIAVFIFAVIYIPRRIEIWRRNRNDRIRRQNHELERVNREYETAIDDAVDTLQLVDSLAPNDQFIVEALIHRLQAAQKHKGTTE